MEMSFRVFTMNYISTGWYGCDSSALPQNDNAMLFGEVIISFFTSFRTHIGHQSKEKVHPGMHLSFCSILRSLYNERITSWL